MIFCRCKIFKRFYKTFIHQQSKKPKKTIDEYAQLTTKIREEHKKSQEDNTQLKIQLHKYKTYIEQLPQKPYQKSYSDYRKKPIKKESVIMIQNKKKVMIVILTLQKLGDALKTKKENNL